MKLLMLLISSVFYLLGVIIMPLSYVFWFPDSWVEYRRYKNHIGDDNQVSFLSFSFLLTMQLNLIYLARRKMPLIDFLTEDDAKHEFKDNRDLRRASEFIWARFLQLKYPDETQ